MQVRKTAVSNSHTTAPKSPFHPVQEQHSFLQRLTTHLEKGLPTENTIIADAHKSILSILCEFVLLLYTKKRSTVSFASEPLQKSYSFLNSFQPDDSHHFPETVPAKLPRGLTMSITTPIFSANSVTSPKHWPLDCSIFSEHFFYSPKHCHLKLLLLLFFLNLTVFSCLLCWIFPSLTFKY